MIGILVELILSWLLLWLFDKSNLLSLGIRPTKERIYNFLLGFFVASFFCIFYYFTTASLADNNYTLNKEFTVTQFFKSSSWTLNSVLFEELIFRGAMLYIAIKKLGIRRACIISAIAFGIYHWFSYGAFGNPIQMLLVFIMTGIWGLMFAFAFAKTKSLYLPIGIHFGWNLINIVIFSNGPLGHQLLFSSNENKLEGLLSLLFFIMQIITLPILTYLFLKTKIKSNIKSVQ
jgi:membrane protease YdiL (CAAX protease family)